MYRLVLFVFVASGWAGASAETISERAKADKVEIVANDNARMQEAFRKARASLRRFLEMSDSRPPGTAAWSVKVPIRDGKEVEYFWIGAFERTGSRFVGRIDNVPRLVRTVVEGQQYAFEYDDIVDWMYIDQTKSQMHGNFTACALLSGQPKEEAEEAQRLWGLTCE